MNKILFLLIIVAFNVVAGPLHTASSALGADQS